MLLLFFNLVWVPNATGCLSWNHPALPGVPLWEFGCCNFREKRRHGQLETNVQGNLYKSQESSKKCKGSTISRIKLTMKAKSKAFVSTTDPLPSELYQRWPQHSPCAGQWEGPQQHALRTRKNMGMRIFGSSFWVLLLNKSVNCIQFQRQILQTEAIISNLCYWGLILGLINISQPFFF